MDRQTALGLVTALGALTGWLSVTRMTAGVVVLPDPWGLAALLPVGSLRWGPVWAALTLALLVALGGLVRGRRPLTSSVAAAALLTLAATLELSVRHTEMPGLDLMMGMNLVLAHAVAALHDRDRPRHDGARHATVHAVACGAVAAMFGWAGLSKLLQTGWAWVDGRPLALLVLQGAEAGHGASLLAGLRGWVAGSTALCLAGAAFALLLELAAPLMLVPSARRPYGVAALCLFLGLALLLGVIQPAWLAWFGYLAAFPSRSPR